MSHIQAKTAIVAGATGLVGSALIGQLLEHPAYGRVIALSRRELGISHPRLEVRSVSFEHLEQQLEGELLQGADVFCSLGSTIKKAGSKEAFKKIDYGYPMALGRLAQRHDAACFVLVTAMGTSERSLFFYSRVKGEAERDLAALGLRRFVTLRPSLLLGSRQEHRPGERAAIALYRIFGPLLLGPLAKYRANEDRDVALAMIEAARVDSPSFEVIEAGDIARRAANAIAAREQR